MTNSDKHNNSKYQRQIDGVSMYRLLDVWETLSSFSKSFLSNTFSQNIDNCSVAFSLLFSIFGYKCKCGNSIVEM